MKNGPDRAILNPSNTSYSVNTNSLIPAVTCSADCNPPCDINWYKGTAITQTGPQLSLGSADKSKAGNYFCRVENTQGKKESPVSITVTGLGVATQTLRLGSVTPSISGRYTCTASNGADSSSVSFTLDVHFLFLKFCLFSSFMFILMFSHSYDPPAVPASGDFISPATKSYRAEEGAVVLPDITCSASCNPSCTITWTKNNLNYNSGPILSLGTAQRDDTGSYKCTASNGLGNASVVVDVQIECKILTHCVD
ncbi:hypothetical protein C0Q70_12675 [Pomacea canaliculata]|uniref:Ig-like domain-containing protein n=1 Tax=Pomacea canaliculata TaxID=400727 RepID=A0A2T7P298_POMCA|nr:hypothetical protein C0Q70_12675 [Pomacea canaliculata]